MACVCLADTSDRTWRDVSRVRRRVRAELLPMETHYAYRVAVESVDERGNPTKFRDVATKTFNLTGVKALRRSKLIGALINNHGECLAKLPLKFDRQLKSSIDLNELTKFINGEE
jgi:hypothetical protein